MADIGRLIEGILCVKCNGKWKRRLCSLEKQATFTNSLKFYVVKREDSTCVLQDVVHAYLWSLDPNHPGTIMLICNYKVRCISFDQFEELNNWVEILKTYLTCNYFHADLVLASKESTLYAYARRRRRQLRCMTSQKLASNTPSSSSGAFRLPQTVRDDGYLHVTRDRICFTTSPGCARPRLLATWSFDNDELVQCCTGRVISAESDTDRANLFCLTASADHPEAPGSHLFISDRASELCEWIEANNQTAIYQAEWRRLTSMTAIIDGSFVARSSVSPSGATGCGQMVPSLDCYSCNYSSLLFTENAMSTLGEQPDKDSCLPQEVNLTSRSDHVCEDAIPTSTISHRLLACASLEPPSSDHAQGVAARLECANSSSNSLSNLSSTTAERQKATRETEPSKPAGPLSGQPQEASMTANTSGESLAKFAFPNASARAEFLARKQSLFLLLLLLLLLSTDLGHHVLVCHTAH